GYAGQGPATVSMKLQGRPCPCDVTFTGTGTVGMTATREKRGNDTVWVVRSDELSSSESMTAQSCAGGASSFAPPGGGIGYTQRFVRIAGDIVIPGDGGSLAVHTSKV